MQKAEEEEAILGYNDVESIFQVIYKELYDKTKIDDAKAKIFTLAADKLSDTFDGGENDATKSMICGELLAKPEFKTVNTTLE